MKMFIKYMVSNRCKMAVKNELRKLHLHFVLVDLGEVEVMEDISAEQREQLRAGLSVSGLELIDDHKAVLIEKIKTAIIELVHYPDVLAKVNFSDFISKKLDYDYTYLANLFSEVQGTTIEQFTISHKVERVKELLIYDELNISEIAWKMNYSSAAHLSNQFKKATGLSPTHFKQLKTKMRSPIEEVGESAGDKLSRPQPLEELPHKPLTIVINEQKKAASKLTEAIVIAENAQSKAEKATQVAEDALRSKQTFLSNMSHEIRTPMNAIVGFTKVLLKTDLTAKQTEYLMAIKVSGNSLVVLLNDILDLAKVDAGKMTFEHIPFKIATSLSAAMHLFETKIQEKNLALVKVYDERIDDVLLGDPMRLNQIMLNLMSNAVKFTTNGEITVCVRLLAEDTKCMTVEFSVTDTGIGISEDKLGNIFENFQQATNGTSRLYGGTGLGLAIVKQLVEKQGGHMHVESSLGKGSTFSFSLTFLKTDAEAAIEVEILAPDTSIPAFKVLVAEDVPLNQLLMKTLLDDFGFSCDIAENGRIAIEKMQENSYDIILMDLQMPEMNGFEATDYIRREMKSTIPIIALTADVTTVDLLKCKEAGMDDYIAKPVDERFLYSKIMLLAKHTDTVITIGKTANEADINMKYTNLDYLTRRTKSNPKLMSEIILLYLEQTPPLIIAMRQGLDNKDWNTLQKAVHKIIPSFSIMGISADFEQMAKLIQEHAKAQKHAEELPAMVLQIEKACMQACEELKEVLMLLKIQADEQS